MMKRSLVLVLGLVIIGSLTGLGCGTVKRQDFNQLIKGAGLPDDLAKLIGEASLAPSSHNTQPWKVKIVSDSEIILQVDQSRWLDQVDSTKRELFISLGTFWENLEESAPELGYQLDVTVLAKDFNDTDLVKVKLTKVAPQPGNRLALIQKRATLRGPYALQDLNPEQLTPLQQLLPDHLLYFSRRSQQGIWLAGSLIDANKQQGEVPGAADELGRWLRFSVDEANQKGDGLTPEMLGLGPLERFYWYNFMSRKDVSSESFRSRGVENTKKQVNSCSGFAVIVSDGSTPADLLQAGRNYEKFALKCTELGVAYQPMSQLIEELPWKNQLNSMLGSVKPIQFVIRMGYATTQPVLSIHRLVKELIAK